MARSSKKNVTEVVSLPPALENSMVDFGAPLEFPGPYSASERPDTLGIWVVYDSRGDKLLKGSEAACKMAAASLTYLYNKLKAEGKIEGD